MAVIRKWNTFGRPRLNGSIYQINLKSKNKQKNTKSLKEEIHDAIIINDEAPPEENKWPFIYTIIGVSIFCVLSWFLILKIIF